MDAQRIQEKVQLVTNFTGPTGAATATAGALTFNEWLAVGGFLIALASFFVNWYYQHKRDKREQERANDV